jgi:CRISP-associated protein Cas1
MHDLHDLPKFRDGLSYLYVEHCTVDKDSRAIAVHDADGKTPVPASALALLMLGPGTKITHAAIRALADNGCLAVWCGEEGVRLYAQGLGETRSASALLRQAELVCNPNERLRIVREMYSMRFPERLEDNLTLQQIRGKEGMRVRAAYLEAAREYGIEWHGRSYNRSNWKSSDPANRALSAANSCLYGLCHAAILSAGYSPALGFIHTGKQLSFVYDIADLYKAEVCIPVAFAAAAEDDQCTPIERRVRVRLRDRFRDTRLLQRIVKDLQSLIACDIHASDRHGSGPGGSAEIIDFDNDDGALPGGLWEPDSPTGRPSAGGRNYADGSGDGKDDEEEFPWF